MRDLIVMLLAYIVLGVIMFWPPPDAYAHPYPPQATIAHRNRGEWLSIPNPPGAPSNMECWSYQWNNGVVNGACSDVGGTVCYLK